MKPTVDLLNVISELTQNIPELHHVLRDGVEVLQSTVDVTWTFIQIQSIIQDDFVTKSRWLFFKSKYFPKGRQKTFRRYLLSRFSNHMWSSIKRPHLDLYAILLKQSCNLYLCL